MNKNHTLPKNIDKRYQNISGFIVKIPLVFIILISGLFAYDKSESALTRSDNTNYEYFFGDMSKYLGIYSGPYIKFTSIANKFTGISGGGGGLYFFHRVFVIYELFGMWVPEPLNDTTDFQFSQSGGIIGYVFKPEKKVHLTIQSFVGTSSFEFLDKNGIRDTSSLSFLLFEPAFDCEFNIAQNFRGTLGASYRINIGNEKHRGLSSKDLNGFSFNVGFKFGGF